jgi:hypothetical protein
MTTTAGHSFYIGPIGFLICVHWMSKKTFTMNRKVALNTADIDMHKLSGCELIDTKNIGMPSQNMKFAGLM